MNRYIRERLKACMPEYDKKGKGVNNNILHHLQFLKWSGGEEKLTTLCLVAVDLSTPEYFCPIIKFRGFLLPCLLGSGIRKTAWAGIPNHSEA